MPKLQSTAYTTLLTVLPTRHMELEGALVILGNAVKVNRTCISFQSSALQGEGFGACQMPGASAGNTFPGPQL